ncbi:MAG: hypothetical protein ACHREM_33910 [Polyangiales bacterium]
MASEALVSKVKELMTLTKQGQADAAFAGYVELFQTDWFMDETPEDRRKALKIVVCAKVIPNKVTPANAAAHRAAMIPLKQMIADLNEPQDMETLGICHAMVHEDDKAAAVFRNALTIERARDPQSVLCGSLMKWVSAV